MKTRIYAAPAVKGVKIKTWEWLVSTTWSEIVGRGSETQLQVGENVHLKVALQALI